MYDCNLLENIAIIVLSNGHYFSDVMGETFLARVTELVITDSNCLASVPSSEVQWHIF